MAGFGLSTDRYVDGNFHGGDLDLQPGPHLPQTVANYASCMVSVNEADVDDDGADQPGSAATLTDVEDSVLIAVDVQQRFLDKLAPEEVAPLVSRISWIVRIATTLGVPVVATAEDIAKLGTTVDAVADEFLDGTAQHNKMTFGLAGDPAILSAVEEHGRRTAVFVGLETDVCVMQSALGLLQRGFRVVVLADATASPGPCHEAGITRMRDAGAIISTVKGTFYEWVRSLDFADQHLDPKIWTDPRPDGVHL